MVTSSDNRKQELLKELQCLHPNPPCKPCYTKAREAVERGELTWADLIEAGIVKYPRGRKVNGNS